MESLNEEQHNFLIQYLKKLYIINGVNIPVEYFWYMGDNPYEEFLEDNFGITSIWKYIQYYDYGVTKDIDMDGNYVQLTEKFIKIISNH